MISFQYNRTRFEGFTLIELLTVVAIISVLMAILMPALSKARTLAYRIQCSGKLRGLSLAWHVYCEENDGRFYQGVNANLNYGGWDGVYSSVPRPLNPYLKLPLVVNTPEEAEAFQCPADRGGAPGAFIREKVYNVMGTSYGTNIFLVGQNAVGIFSEQTAELDEALSRRIQATSTKDITRDSRLMLIGDYGWYNQWNPRPHALEEWKALAEWHKKPEHFNIGFVDGHVDFTHIKKGYYITEDYTVVPFDDLHDDAEALPEIVGQ